MSISRKKIRNETAGRTIIPAGKGTRGMKPIYSGIWGGMRCGGVRTGIVLAVLLVLEGGTILGGEPHGKINIRTRISSPGTVPWLHDLRTARVAALRTHKPILLVFSTKWCAACQRLNREVFAQPEISRQIQTDFIPVLLDADQQEKLTELLDVTAVPCSVVLTADAQILERIDSYLPPRQFSDALATSSVTFEHHKQAILQVGAEEPAPVKNRRPL